MLEIKLHDGTSREVYIDKFPALEGWDIQREFLDFAASTDKDFRRGFVMRVLAYSYVNIGENKMNMSTSAVIDNHLGKWENVELVFTSVLDKNGIDPKNHAQNPAYWEEVGAKIAISFIAECAKLMGPAFQIKQ